MEGGGLRHAAARRDTAVSFSHCALRPLAPVPPPLRSAVRGCLCFCECVYFDGVVLKPAFRELGSGFRVWGLVVLCSKPAFRDAGFGAWELFGRVIWVGQMCNAEMDGFMNGWDRNTHDIAMRNTPIATATRERRCAAQGWGNTRKIEQKYTTMRTKIQGKHLSHKGASVPCT